ncbi:ATPase, T2SS/T4P/T4SS family [Alicyclobacillus fastidiosus]|uniref:ATPase, T2SS/T4P/T4SS family n=1 Tax=Alicyclobacillus fastidiosus TaxID=392011 RepID=A0ABY6ZN09_9BACL|nr:ATPase, T2SS/T4P/T4SS family [Alicyclobacillus fastidiosus]WAH44269.1 ATPase, T2SS/T4P/T4SS family [Alicyclobacillus fastidiosus]GMA60591.1 hypothetical protein GCM10025859_10310 [Alicyclobacillus fastidiosus]
MEGFTAARVLQQIIDCAISSRATDIHLTSTHAAMRVDFRIDGAIRPFVHLTERGDELVRRIKALGRMDVTNGQAPQEGVFTWEMEHHKARLRVSAVPVYAGESVVLRVLNQFTQPLGIFELGMTPAQVARLVGLLSEPSGLILVAGRTGSGKTTTLYAMMHHLAMRGLQVFSLEDPVEMPIPNCRQLEVRERSGMTYELGLKSLLRQDPDVLMIGEIRDPITARIAVRAALTGRLVLATTHAADASSSLDRLLDFDVPKTLLAGVLRAVLVQHASLLPQAAHQSAFTFDDLVDLESSAGRGLARTSGEGRVTTANLESRATTI